MSQLRVRAARLPIVGAIVGLGVLRLLRGRRRRRPTGAELMAMDDVSFAAFIESTGLKTVTDADLGPSESTD
jgi:hypothetical protein